MTITICWKNFPLDYCCIPYSSNRRKNYITYPKRSSGISQVSVFFNFFE